MLLGVRKIGKYLNITVPKPATRWQGVFATTGLTKCNNNIKSTINTIYITISNMKYNYKNMLM